ncbi:MAG: heavy-metal-associated domain-containing protein [Chitinophagaceae bacterium]
MKYSLLFVLFFSGASLFAQVKPVVTQIIKIPQASCISCKERIESQVKRYDGVLEFVVNYRKGEARVKFLTDRTDIEQIKTAISNTGYDADDILANPDAYNRLPKACKRTLDGGSHPI